MERIHTMASGCISMTHWIDTTMQRFVWIAQAVIVIGILTVGYYATDRDAPFEVLSVEPAEARPGDYVTIRAQVRRDEWRACSASFSRYVFASDGARFDMGSNYASPEMVSQMQRTAPNMLAITFRVPEEMSAGRATVMTALEYRCNKVHNLWPIEVTTAMPFTVLP